MARAWAASAGLVAPGGDGFFGEGDCRRGRVSALEAMGPPAGHPGQSLIPLALGFGERAAPGLSPGPLGPSGVSVCVIWRRTSVRAYQNLVTITALSFATPQATAGFWQWRDCPGSRRFARAIRPFLRQRLSHPSFRAVRGGLHTLVSTLALASAERLVAPGPGARTV